MIALSIRQPWAWLIVHGYKDIENRTWATSYRGDFLVHAGKGMTHDEYDEACSVAFQILGIGFDLIPTFDDLPRGGIVGAAKIIECVKASESPWFFGDYGFVIKGAIEIPFMPYRGQLGFFEVEARAAIGKEAPHV
jgi:hypothetical protein